jgi:hypothetical protein
MGKEVRRLFELLALVTFVGTSGDLGAQGGATVPLTSRGGFTVNVPADWRIHPPGSDGDVRAFGPDGWARVEIVDEPNLTVVAMFAKTTPNLQSIAHKDGTIVFRKDVHPPRAVYTTYVRLGDRAARVTCGESPETEKGASGCLTIIGTSRLSSSPPASAAGAGRSQSATAPSGTPPPAGPSPPAPASPGARSSPAPNAAATAPVGAAVAIPEGEVLPPGWRDFGNVAVGTTKTIRIVLPCNSLRIQGVTPSERQSEFRIMPSEPAMGRTAEANGRQIPFQCPAGNKCVHPFSFSPKSPIARIIVNFTCDTISHMMYGSAR